MSKICWLFLIAVGGLNTAQARPIILYNDAVLVCDDTGCRERSNEENTYQPSDSPRTQERPTDERENAPNIIIQSFEPDTPSAEPPPQRAEERAEEDLDAQQSMAVWARAMFWATSLGVGLISWTLIETRKTANIARRSLDSSLFVGRLHLRQGRKATKAALDSVAVTREVGQAQARAYINARESKFSFKNGSQLIGFWLELYNSGNSPARKVRVTNIKVGVGPRSVIEPEFFDFEDLVFHEIPAQSEGIKEGRIAFDYTFKYASPVSLGDIYLFICGDVTFDDVFDEPQTSQIAVSGRTMEDADKDFVFHGKLTRTNPDVWDQKDNGE